MSENKKYILKLNTLTIDGLEITYKTIGEGPPIILIHGLSASTNWWTNTIPALASQYKLYLFDLPGFGTMRKYKGSFVLTEAAEWISKICKSLNIHKATYIGHSMGGFICSKIAILYPDSVDKLVLIAPAGIPTGRTILTSIVTLIKSLPYVNPSFFPRLVIDATTAGPRTILNTTKQILVQDLQSDLSRIRAETLLIWGANDFLVPAEHSRYFKSSIKKNKVVIITNAGHIPMVDKPTECNEAIVTFLQEVDSAV